MQTNNLYLLSARCLIFALILMCSPLISYSSQLYHTIQISSFIKMAPAQKQFNSIMKKSNENELDKLRIEKIGRFYSVRLGKFNDFAAAEKFLQELKPGISQATVMEAYIKDNRIKKLYAVSSTVDKQPVKEKSLSNPLAGIANPSTY